MPVIFLVANLLNSLEIAYHIRGEGALRPVKWVKSRLRKTFEGARHLFESLAHVHT